MDRDSRKKTPKDQISPHLSSEKQPLIKTIFFDLGNVLVSFCPDKMWNQLSKVCFSPPSDLKHIEAKHQLWVKLEKGLLSTQDLISVFEQELKRKIPNEAFTEAASAIFETIPSAEITLKSLLNQGIELILISNTCDMHFQYITKHFPFISLFHHHVLSYEVNLSKPDPKIYSYALNLTSSKKEECFYVDDVEPFILSAQSCGILGHVYKSESLLKSTLLSLGLIV